MKKKNKRLHGNLKKKVYTTSVTLALTAGTVAGVAAYQSNLEFTPSGVNRKLQNNQVLFPEDETDSIQHDQDKTDKDKSALWEKNNPQEDAKDGLADFLFDSTGYGQEDGKDQIALVSEDEDKTPDHNQTVPGTANPDQVYEVTDDKTKADTIITDPTNKPSTTEKPLPGTGDADNTGSTGNETGDDETGNNGTGSETGNTGTGNDHEKPDAGNSGNSGNSGSKDETDEKPVKKPSSTAKDPDVNLEDKYPSSDSKPFQEGVIKEDDFSSIGTDSTDTMAKYMLVIMQDYWSTERLYEGRSVDEETIFYALDCRIVSKDDPSGLSMVFRSDSYGKYIRVDSVSFDEGKTWNADFPVTIPEGASDTPMLLKISWRVSTKQDWAQTEVSYDVEKTRLFVLNKQIKDENYKIEKDDVINWDDILVGQYPEIGQKVNMLSYSYMRSILGEGTERQTALFPGWSEGDGAPGWMYTVERGRHILEPADKVSLDEAYIVKPQYYWISDELKVDINGSTYGILQTLTGYEGEFSLWKDQSTVIKTLSVPKYVQSVDIESDTPLTVDTLVVPDTVLYINTENTNMLVNEAYEVDSDNPNYCSVNGILCDRERTEILGVPYRIRTMDVPASVKTVTLSDNNQIQKVQFFAETMEDLPNVSFSSFHNCHIIVQDQILDQFIEEKGSNLTSGGCVISAASAPDICYTVRNKMAFDQENTLSYVFSSYGDTCNIPGNITSIGQHAFRKAENVTTLVLQGEQLLTLQKDCLKDTQIQTILCRTKEQVDSLQKQLSYAGKTDITLGVSAVTADGFTYYTEVNDGQTIVNLLEVPEDITEFDGTIDNGNIRVNKISAEAFSGSQIVWVTLPEETTVIGSGAFKDCADLQGVLIDTREKITIGDNAFEGCSALRFVASNAAEAVMQNDYDPVITANTLYLERYCFYILPGAEGYGAHSRTVSNVSGLSAYTMDQVSEDSRILYGLDSMGNRWIAVRSGSLLPDKLELPEDVSMIMACAFSDTHTTSGSCEVNLDELFFLGWIEEGAFANSDISGDVTLGVWRNQLVLNSEAFENCEKLTSVTINSQLLALGESVFEGSSNLKMVDFKSLSSSVNFYSGLFNNCNNLEEIRFYTKEPPRRSVYGESAFQFNMYWTKEEEAEHLRIRVPEGAEETYVMDWRYLSAGYSGGGNAGYSAYLDMWNGIRDELLFTYWVYPDNSEVDALLRERLCDTENYLRKMLGLATVREATDLYIWHQDDIYLSLAGVPSYIKKTDLSAETLDMPEGWTLDTINADAFAGASQIEKVEIPSTLVGIASNAFRGSTSGDLTLEFKGESSPELTGGTKDEPFTFGLQENKLHIKVPENTEKTYIQSWIYPFSGYTDEEDVLAEAKQLTEEEDTQETDILIRRKAAELLLPTENRLRRMMGLDELSSIDDGMFSISVPKLEKTVETPEETQPSDTTETEENPQNPDPAGTTDTAETTDPAGDADQSEVTEPSENADTAENPDASTETGMAEGSDASDTSEKSAETATVDEKKVSGEKDVAENPDDAKKTDTAKEKGESK